MKKKITLTTAAIVVVLAAGLQKLNAQWNLNGNNDATETSKLGTRNSQPVRLFTKNSERMRIDTFGRVGIGITLPIAPLSFSSATGQKITLGGTTTANYGLGIGVDLLQIHTKASYSDIAFGYGSSTSFTERMRVQGNGNVGIGTSAPQTRLHISSGAIGEVMRLNGPSSTFATLYEGGVLRGYWGSYSGNAEDMDFGATSATGKVHLTTQAIPRFTIDAAGNAGVGTMTPAAKLHVAGNVKIDGSNSLEFGAGLSKEINAGKIGYGNITPGELDIVGAGTTTANRKIKFWSEGGAEFSGNVGIGASAQLRKLHVQDGDLRMSSLESTARYLEFLSTAASVNDVRLEYNASNKALFFSSSTNDFINPFDFHDLARFDLATSPTYVFTVHGSALANGGFWVDSDAKLKKGVDDFSNATDIIKQLVPKTYFFKTGEYSNLNLPTEKQYGFLAQDLEKTLPELVKTSQQMVSVNKAGERQTEEIKAINYTELIPILTKAIQEQDEKIRNQQQQIDELKQIVNNITGGQKMNSPSVSEATNAVITSAVLEQNEPNPLKANTTIRYKIPGGSKNAQLSFTDLSGKTVRVISLKNADAGIINLDASTLSNGTYTYSLFANGKLIGSKKMIVSH